MNVLTIFTNWKRKKNLEEIIIKTCEQSLKPDIVIIDNASNDPENRFETNHSQIQIIRRDNSMMCWERWIESFNHEHKYKCIMDDDICFSKKDVLEQCYKFMEENESIDCIGPEGVLLLKGKGYFEGPHQLAKGGINIPVSVIKGRFMFVRSKSLDGMDMKPDLTCDDIKVSSHLKNKVLPEILFNSFCDLPQGDESLSGKHYQALQRDYAVKKYFRN